MDCRDPRGRPDGVDRLGPAVTLVGHVAGRWVGRVVDGPADLVVVWGRRRARGAVPMRNGLDYLNYQQYERALKFLREAELNQKELTAAEIVALKQGIERARQGMRQGADAGPSYALSEKSHRRSGFTAARPETAVAQRSDAVAPPARTKSRSGPSALPAADDGPGEPIRLTSAEAVVGESPAPAGGPGLARGTSTALTPLPGGDEIPTLTAPEIPTLTAVPTSSDPAGPGSVASPSSSQSLAAAAPRAIPSDPAISGAAVVSGPAETATPRASEPGAGAVSPTGPAAEMPAMETPTTSVTDPGSGPRPAAASPRPARRARLRSRRLRRRSRHPLRSCWSRWSRRRADRHRPRTARPRRGPPPHPATSSPRR